MAKKPAERRAAKRYPIGFRALEAYATINGARIETVNISQTGLLAQIIEDAPTTGTVEIDIPGLGPRPATIVWRTEKLVGLQFNEPIEEKALAELLARAQ